MHRYRIQMGEERSGLSLFTSQAYVDIWFSTKINRKNKNHKAVLFQGLGFQPSSCALPGAEEPYLLVLGTPPDSASQDHFKVSLTIDFSSFSPVCTQPSFLLLTQLL